MRDGHVHLSVISVAGTVAVILLTNFILHQLALKLGSSDDENKRKWGEAIVAGFGM